jgi:hypothetical protein
VSWQPIDTAPKDGTTILVVHQVSREVFPAKFSEYRGPQGKSELAVYLVENGHISHGYAHWSRLTHWMPLPKPPKEGE